MQFPFKTPYAYFPIISSLICTTLYVLLVYQPCISIAANRKATNDLDYHTAPVFSSSSQTGAATRFFPLKQDNNKLPEFTAVYNISYPYWHNIWSSQDENIIQHNLLGLRVKKEQNYVWDWEYNRSNLTLAGESSHASTAEYYNINSFLPASAAPNKKDNPHKITAVVSTGSSQWELGYELVPSQYISLLDSATPDQETVRAKWSNRLSDDVNYHISGSWFRDKIGDASTATYRTYRSNPEAGVIVQKILGNPDAALIVNYSQSNREGGSSEGRDGSWTIGYQDIWGKVNVQTSLSHTNSRDSSNRMDISRNNTITYSAALSASYKQGRYNITPSLTWGYYQQNDLLNFEQEKTYETSLAIDTSEHGAAFSSVIKLSKKNLISPSRGDSPQWFANLNIDWVPPFLTKNPGSKLYFRAYINDYKYNTAPHNNYRETSYNVGISQTF